MNKREASQSFLVKRSLWDSVNRKLYIPDAISFPSFFDGFLVAKVSFSDREIWNAIKHYGSMSAWVLDKNWIKGIEIIKEGETWFKHIKWTDEEDDELLVIDDIIGGVDGYVSELDTKGILAFLVKEEDFFMSLARRAVIL